MATTLSNLVVALMWIKQSSVANDIPLHPSRPRAAALAENRPVPLRGDRPHTHQLTLKVADRMTVVVVESPAKAKTINKYLGSGYTVLASYGHVRDLPAKDGSVRPDEDFSMSWELDSRAAKRISAIAEAVKSADKLILATDPDREGEAISWHVLEILQRKGALKAKTVERVVFNAVTRGAVLEAMRNPRQIDGDLVEAV